MTQFTFKVGRVTELDTIVLRKIDSIRQYPILGTVPPIEKKFI
jgi:hypothetical protein